MDSIDKQGKDKGERISTPNMTSHKSSPNMTSHIDTLISKSGSNVKNSQKYESKRSSCQTDQNLESKSIYSEGVSKQPESNPTPPQVLQRKYQVRQFTLGNEFENAGLGYPSQLIDSLANRKDGARSLALQAGSVCPEGNNRMIMEMRQCMSDLLSRVQELELRIDGNEEKQQLREKLFELKGSQMESAQIVSVSQVIKSDLEQYFRGMVAQQQDESDRVVECMCKLDTFERNLRTSEEYILKKFREMERKISDSQVSQTRALEQAIMDAQTTSSLNEKTYFKKTEFNLQLDSLNEKIRQMMKEQTLHREETIKTTQGMNKSIVSLENIQNRMNQDITENISPAIKSVEEDLFRVLASYKEMSDHNYHSKFLESEIIQLKHRIKILFQNVQINQSRYTSHTSLTTLQNQ